MSSVTEDILSAWRRGGLQHILARSPSYLTRQIFSLIYIPFNYKTITRDEFISYCEKNGGVGYYSSETEFEMTPPLNHGRPYEYDELVGTVTVEPNFVCEVSNVTLVGPYAIPQLPNGNIVLETFKNSISTFENRLNETFETIGTVRTVKSLISDKTADQNIAQYDTVAHLVTRAGHSYDRPNYVHWVAEILPQLRAIEHYRKVTNKQPKLLINSDPPSWLTELLELMGYSSDDWIEWDQPTGTVKNLVIPKLNHLHSVDVEPNPSDRRWARDRLPEQFSEDESSSEFEERVFLSREGADRRNILNIEEVKDLLAEYGFGVYQLENLDMSEEIELVSQAEILAGPIGANLGAIMFSSDAKVIEIFPHGVRTKFYYTLCNELGLDHLWATGKPLSSSPGETNLNDDILVDIDELEELIQECIQN